MSSEVLFQLVFCNKCLRAAGARKGLVAGVTVYMPHELVRGREVAFVTACPVAQKVTGSTDVVRFDMIIELFRIEKLVTASDTLRGPVTAVLSVH